MRRTKENLGIIGLITIIAFIVSINSLFSQGRNASPANWLYPDGNSEATKYIKIKSYYQDINSFKVKWSTDTIAGDLKPLIGNIIFNESLIPSFPFGPNELTAVIGGKILVVDAKGKTHKPAKLPPFAKDITVLFDTLQTSVSSYVTNSVVLGIETVEAENLKDSLAYAYVCSYDEFSDSVAILKRLAVNLRNYPDNIFGSVKPVFGKRIAGMNQIYATVNMSKPTANDPAPVIPSFFRGITQFNSNILRDYYPLNDIGDDFDSRNWVGYEMNFAQPSISVIDGNRQMMLLPSYPSTDLDVLITNPRNLEQSYSNRPYIMSVNMDNPSLAEDISPLDFSSILLDTDKRPQLRPYYVQIKDLAGTDSIFILVAEEYRGTEGSNGKSKLHLFKTDGTPITLPLEKIGGTGLPPSIQGANDHLWSVAIGNVDGNSSNSLLPSYPNNLGNEILVTQSTREFVVPNNKLMVLRYYTGTPVPKKSPPQTDLNAFDTICTFRINGWLAAVNDIDDGADQKDEIFIVEGSKLYILRMNDYTSYEFRDGHYFDTVKIFKFYYQDSIPETIQNVAIADLEGDGRNDIIVTTNARTHIIGTELYDILNIIYPKAQRTPPEQFCVNDTIPIRWRNIFFKDKEVRPGDTLRVNIFFRPYLSGTAQDTLIPIASGLINENDTMVYRYVVNDLVFGREGRFLVIRNDHPGIVRDSTSIVSFIYPGISIDGLPRYTYYADERLNLTGSAYCLDSVTIEYSYDGIIWNIMGKNEVIAGNYSVFGDLPCPSFYDCILPDTDSILQVIIVGHKAEYSDTSSVLPIWLLPEIFPSYMEPCTTSCPTRIIRWDINDLENPCDSVIISIADINSNTFSFVDKISSRNGYYEWSIPVNVPEWIKVRLCCENSCVRKDTIMHDIRASYIGIVAPNPFKPLFEEVDITYRVPKDTYVTVRILDQANRLVREIINSEPRKKDIVYCEKWDGKIHDGSLAANGMYYIYLELSDGQKEIYPVYVRK